jgi:hypothetical protein
VVYFSRDEGYVKSSSFDLRNYVDGHVLDVDFIDHDTLLALMRKEEGIKFSIMKKKPIK